MIKKFNKQIFIIVLNILGLTIAFTSFALIIKWVDYELTYDKCYTDYDRIYRLEVAFDMTDPSSYQASIGRPIGRLISENTPGIAAAGEIGWSNSKTISDPENSNKQEYNVEILNITREFLDIIDIKPISGDKSKFLKKNDILIAKSLSEKLFKDENPIGKTLNMIGDTIPLNIVGVFEDYRENSSIRNDIFVNMGDDFINDYSEWSFNFYFKLNPNSNKEEIEEAIRLLLLEKLEIGKDYPMYNNKEAVRLTNIHDIYYTNDIKYDSVDKGNITTTYSLLTIAILIICIAIINFFNLSIANIPSNIKSINTNKILGDTRINLIINQIIFSIIISLISLGLSILLIYLLKGSIHISQLSKIAALSSDMKIFVITFVIAILSGIISAIYPAIYSTSFTPAIILKGSFSLSPKGKKLRSLLIAFQYIISIVLIIISLFINIQTNYMKQYNMGFDRENILTTQLSWSLASMGEDFSEILMRNPIIKDVAYADGYLVSNGKMGWGRNFNGEQIHFDCFPVSTNFLKFFSMEIIDGRDFTNDDKLKSNGTYIFNETASKKFSIKVGDKINGHVSGEAEIVGIVKDFNFQPLQYKINPIALYVMGANPWRPQFMCYIKLAPNSNIKESFDYIRKVIKEVDPNMKDEKIAIDFLDNSINNLYLKEEALGQLILIFCIISILISIIGVLGLIYFETQYKKREIGVRRILGSSITEILILFNKSYLKTIIICFVLAIPISIYIIKLWLKSFVYQSNIPLWIFIVALLIISIITILIITLRSLSAALSNPINSIKAE